MVLLRYLRNHFKPEVYGYGYKGLFKQGMIENPAVTFTIIACPLILIGIFPFHLYQNAKTEISKKRYLYRYSIYRPDDERLDWLILPPKLDAEVKERRLRGA